LAWVARKIDRVVIDWPSGGTEEYKDLRAGKTYNCLETKGIDAVSRGGRMITPATAEIAIGQDAGDD